MKFFRLLVIAAALACLPSLAAAAEATPSPSPSPSATPSPAPSPLAQLQWRNVGPAVSGGRLGAVTGTDLDSALYYAGAAGGGVWKSVNAGQSWRPVFDNQKISSIGALAIDPAHKETVWVGTGEGNPRNDVSQGDGVYRSTDGGGSWQHVLSLKNACITSILIDPRRPDTVLVGVLGDPFADSADRGVYRTTDGGKTWSKTLYLSMQSGVSDMATSSKDRGVIYAGMWQMRRTGWSIQSGGADDGLFKSTDGGVTWTRLEGRGLPTDEEGRIGLAVAPSNPDRVYALIQSKQGLLWRSDDNGANWQMVSDNTLINERPFYFSHVFVDPKNADHVWSVSVHLTVSRDGGKTFVQTGRGTHGDHHSMWLAAGGQRIIEGDDGGAYLSFDNGATWQSQKALPIAQLYRAGFDRQTPYHVCAPLQDNGVWCARNNSLSGRGISASDWRNQGGGDGTWVVPDPLDSHLLWSTSGGQNFAGEIDILDQRTGESRSAAPYMRDQNVVDPKDLLYRFNWETPIAFDPFNAHVAYSAGNVLFSTMDRGYHWRVRSPDLTRNEKAHEVISGGITLEGTGAETSDTILDIEPSTVASGEIWTGSDDGVISLTRDAARHWRNVTPLAVRAMAGNAGFGRFESLSASRASAGTLYAVYDAHMVGDHSPHIFATQDFGTHWIDISRGLPENQEARSVREDPRNPSIVYAGLENSFWMSLDRGAHWQSLNINLPATSIRDIRVHPDANDLIVATHGRSMWILDDITPLQQLVNARTAGAYLFSIRPVYEFQLHGYSGTRVDGTDPSYGAIVTFHLTHPALHHPTAEIRDARGRIVRRFTSSTENGKATYALTNQAGMNRFTWDTGEDPPVDWKFTPKWNQGFDSGAQALPGTYTVAVHVDGKTLTKPVRVLQDPRMHWSAAQLQARYAMNRELYGDFDRVDRALNMLSTVLNEAPIRTKELGAKDGGLALKVAAVASQAKLLLTSITQNPVNDQDNDFLTDILRERLQSHLGTFDSFAPPTQAQYQETAALRALTRDRMRAVESFVAGELRAVNAALQAAKLLPLDHLTKMPAVYSPTG